MRLAFPALLLVTLLAFALRLYKIELRDVWWDEGWSIWLARQDPLHIALTTAVDEHPPLHYWLLHFWTPLAGETEFAARFSTLFFGVLAIPLVYQFGSLLAGRSAGLLGALILAIARFHVWWSQEIKMYALAIFLCLLSLYCFVYLIGAPHRWLTVAYIGATVLALYVLYLSVFVLVVEGLFVVIRFLFASRSRSFLMGWAARFGAVVLLFAPWLLFYLTHGLPRQAKEPFEMEIFLWIYTTVLSLGISTNIEQVRLWAVALWAAAALGLVLGFWRTRAKVREGTLLLTLCLLALPIGIYLLSLPTESIYHPKLNARYLVLFVPAFGMLLAQGVVFSWRVHRAGGIAIAGVVVTVLAVSLGDYYQARHRTYDAAALGSFLNAFAREGDVLVLSPGDTWPVYAYHVKTRLLWHRLPRNERPTRAKVAEWLGGIAEQSATVWLVSTKEAASFDPRGEVPRFIAETYPFLMTRSYGQLKAQLFSVDTSRQFIANKVPAAVVRVPSSWEAVRLVGFESIPREVRAGDRFYVTSYWQVPAGLDPPPEAWLELRDERGWVVLSRAPKRLEALGRRRLHGSGLLQGQNPFSISRGVPSGRYWLELNLREAGSGGARRWPLRELSVTNPEGPSRVGLPSYPSPAILGGRAKLLGYDLSSRQPEIGEIVELTLYWEALEEMDTSYTVFVHLLDGENRRLDQRDNIPDLSRSPTTSWTVGEVVKDRYRFRARARYGGGPTHFVVGLYDASTGQRLSLVNEAGQELGATSVTLEGFTVVQPKLR